MIAQRRSGANAGFTLIELLLVVAIIGIVAAIGLPSLIRARTTANEAQAVGDTRSVLSANQSYAAANCGFYAPALTSMTRESGGAITIPNYPAAAPQFLGGDLGRPSGYTKSGYLRTYTGFSPPPTVGPQCDPGSVSTFCYNSTPSSPGLTGVRAFVGTGQGAMYVDSSGAAVVCTNGLPTVGGTVAPLE